VNQTPKSTRFVSAAIGVLAISAFAGVLFGSPANSQEQAIPEDPSAEVCMIAPPNGGEGGRPIHATVPASNARALIADGYRVVNCNAAFSNSQARREWRDQVCELASDPREAFQAEVESVLGARAAELCGMAEQTVGPWQRSGGRNQ